MPRGRIRQITAVPLASQCGSGDLTPSVEVSINGAWYPLRMGLGMWDTADDIYTVRSLDGGTARLLICVPAGTPTVTPLSTPTGTPTGTPTATSTPGTPTATSTPGGLVVIRFAVATASVGEAAGSLTVVVLLTVAQLVPVSVDFATTSFTAMAHSDFAFRQGS